MPPLKETYRTQLVEDLCRFVRIPSRSSPEGGEEGALQALVEERMRRIGARVQTFEADDIPEFYEDKLCFGPERNYKDRPTVIGELGPEGAPSLLILAHSDTVQINNPGAWTFDPFLGEIRDGNICGLGAADDKSGLAMMLTIMQAIQDSGRNLKKRLTFVSSIDEEHGIGNGLLLLALKGIKAEAALYLDGMDMQVCIGNLGGSALVFRQKVPIPEEERKEHADRLRWVCANLSRFRSTHFAQKFYEDNMVRHESVRLDVLSDKRGPYLDVSFYTLPDDDPLVFRTVLEEEVMKALGEEFSKYDLSCREPWFEASLTSPDTPLVKYMSDSVLDILEEEAVVTTISKQDAFVLRNRSNIPTLAFGPTRFKKVGNCHHQPNERIPVDDLWDGCRIVHAAVLKWLGWT